MKLKFLFFELTIYSDNECHFHRFAFSLVSFSSRCSVRSTVPFRSPAWMSSIERQCFGSIKIVRSLKFVQVIFGRRTTIFVDSLIFWFFSHSWSTRKQPFPINYVIYRRLQTFYQIRHQRSKKRYSKRFHQIKIRPIYRECKMRKTKSKKSIQKRNIFILI